jgi:drug/metabolite transporter (DMT)-like permease
VWGVPYLLIRVAVRDLSPADVVFLRTVIAVVVLLPIALRRDVLRPLLERWRPLLLYTLVEVTAPWWLLTSAEEHISSALAGLLIAAVPLIGVLLSRALGHERVDRARLMGLLIGVVGVAALVGIELDDIHLLAVGMVLLTAVGYAGGPLILDRRLADLPPAGVVVASLALTAVVWAVPAALTAPDHVGVKPALSVLGLAVVCTAAAFLVFFALIAEVGPTRAMVITYINPAVAILLGVALLDERFTLGMAIGFPLVLAGSVLATRRASVEPPPVVVAEVSVNG